MQSSYLPLYPSMVPQNSQIILDQNGNPIFLPIMPYQPQQGIPAPHFQTMLIQPPTNALVNQQNLNNQGGSRLQANQQNNPNEEYELFQDRNIRYLKKVWQATKAKKFYKILFGSKIFMQIFLMIYLLMSSIFYFTRPNYKKVEEDGRTYFIAESEPLSQSNYACTEVKNDGVLSLINNSTSLVILALVLFVPYKIFFIVKQSKLFKKVYNTGYVTKSQKFDIYYLDYINIFFDYTFIVILCPLTAVVYEYCPNIRFGLNNINPLVIYILGVVFAIFNYICLVGLLIFCKTKYLDMILYYPIIIMFALPGSIIILFTSIGFAILAAPTTYTTTTTYYSNGSSSTETSSDDGAKMCGAFVCFGIALTVAAYFVFLLIVSFALLFVFCHPAVIFYYVSSITMAVISVCLNKGGSNYVEQYQALLAYLSSNGNAKFSQAFPMLKTNHKEFITNKNINEYKKYEYDGICYLKNEKSVLNQLTVKTTVQKVNNYNQFVEGVVETYYEVQVKKDEIPLITEATVLPINRA